MKIKSEPLIKRSNWNSNTKLAVRVSQTHGLMAQLVRVSKCKSVVLNSKPAVVNIAKTDLMKIQFCLIKLWNLYRNEMILTVKSEF